MMNSDSDDDLPIIIRRPRTFRDRINYNALEPTYEFNERFRMTHGDFSYVLNKLEPVLLYNTNRNRALSPKLQMEVAMHWLGSGVQYHCVGDMHGISKSTVCRVVRKVITAINDNLLQDSVRWPNNIGEVVHQFGRFAGMPFVCGALDGTLINIDAPVQNEACFVDRHGNHSINTMLVCGPDLKFYYVYANWPGSASDARVLRTSGLHQRMEEGWRPFPGGVVLADSIYPLKPWLIPPEIRNPHDESQRQFLRAHRKTRRVIECAIGKLKEKFPVLNHLRVEPRYACQIITACVALCNLTGNDGVGQDELEEQDDNNGYARLAGNDVVENEEREDPPEEALVKLYTMYNHFRD